MGRFGYSSVNYANWYVEAKRQNDQPEQMRWSGNGIKTFGLGPQWSPKICLHRINVRRLPAAEYRFHRILRIHRSWWVHSRPRIRGHHYNGTVYSPIWYTDASPFSDLFLPPLVLFLDDMHTVEGDSNHAYNLLLILLALIDLSIFPVSGNSTLDRITINHFKLFSINPRTPFSTN